MIDRMHWRGPHPICICLASWLALSRHQSANICLVLSVTVSPPRQYLDVALSPYSRCPLLILHVYIGLQDKFSLTNQVVSGNALHPIARRGLGPILFRTLGLRLGG